MQQRQMAGLRNSKPNKVHQAHSRALAIDLFKQLEQTIDEKNASYFVSMPMAINCHSTQYVDDEALLKVKVSQDLCHPF